MFAPRLQAYLAMTRDAGAIAELDGLRALAIALVMLRHAVRPFWRPDAALLPVLGWDAGIPLINGWVGVDLFFVLSGFLITHQICGRYRRSDGRIDLGEYFRRRILRIVPAYYALLFILLLCRSDHNVSLGQVGYHLLFLQDYWPATILVTFWSLGVEEQFYLLAPWLLLGIFRLRRRAQQYWAVAALTTLPACLRLLIYFNDVAADDYAHFFSSYRSPLHVSCDGLCAGMLCALLYRDRARLRWLNDRGLATALFVLGAALYARLTCIVPLLDHITFFDKVPLQSLLALAAASLLLGLVAQGGPGALFRARLWLPVSRLAYSLYLVHMALIPAAQQLCARVTGYAALPRAAQFLVFLLPYTLLSTLAASLLHYGVERPFLLMRERRAAPKVAEVATSSQIDLTPRLDLAGEIQVGANERRASERLEDPALAR